MTVSETSKLSLPKKLAVLGIMAMACWVLLWQLLLSPPAFFPRGVAAALALFPIVPSLLLSVFRRPSAVFWGGVAALVYFCHAIAELWTSPEIWPLPAVELFLSLWIVFTGNWEGLQAKLFKRNPAAKG